MTPSALTKARAPCAFCARLDEFPGHSAESQSRCTRCTA